MDTAIDLLRKAGEAKAATRAGKIAAEGAIFIAVSDDKKKALMAEINSETDFVALSTDFNEFAQAVVAQALAADTDDVATVLALPFKAGQTIEQARQNLVTKIGENIQLRRMAMVTATGMVGHYSHGKRIGVLAALDKNEPEIAKDIAMHIAAFNPQAVSGEDVAPDLIAREREIYLSQAKDSGKPQEIIEKMVIGRLNKFLKEISLLGQPFLKNQEVMVSDVLKTKQIKVSRFVRFEVGEGIEKETKNFADEVMAQVQRNH
jgi:elongation factor Ts